MSQLPRNQQGPQGQVPSPQPRQDPPGPGDPQQAPPSSGRPGAVLAAAALGGAVALVVLGVAVHTLVAGLAGASGGGEVAVVLLALIVGSVGVMHALGVHRLLHPRFPNTAMMAMAGWITVTVTGFGVFRSIRGRGDGPDLTTMLVWVGLAVVVITLMLLITRPSVTRWVRAVHARSRQLGHAPGKR
ncbi:hypothetical protein ABT324_24575 [Saccharopolyspora sp. NPDC000359]|uniref:hypothetical protein n=1 Tax=Saccharopolyspora sp. NPDC000359 TaxID=3154251 RepID=UPI00332D0207